MDRPEEDPEELREELQAAQQRIAELEEREGALQDRIRRLEALTAAMRGMSGIMDLGEIHKAFESFVKGHIPFDLTAVSLLQDERHFEHLATGEVVTTPAEIGRGQSATDWVVENRKPLIRDDTRGDERFRLNARTRASGIRSDVVLPLVSRGEIVGTLSLASMQTGVYREADLEFLQPLADQIAMQMDNARLYRDLRKAYRDLRLIYDGVSDLIFLIQVEFGNVFRCVSVNRAYLSTTGYPEAEVVGKRLEEFLQGPAADFALRKYREAVRRRGSIQFEESVRPPNGPLSLETTVTPVFDEKGVCTHLLGVARNISERKQTEQEIIRLERLHALEEMARGVAHNFNNILVGVLGYAQLIEMQSQDDTAAEYARQIVESALRAKDLVHRLNLSVGRGGDNPPYKVDSLNQIVQEAIETTRPKWKDEAEAEGVFIQVETVLKEVPPVAGTNVGLHHILVHLISNAVDAMIGKGGTLTISTWSAGNLVALVVKDEGLGMDAETQQRIFEPFFTTRQDVGSGLGLSMTYRTVTSWGGRIGVESAPGAGATFTVLLPVWKGEVEEKKEVEVDAVDGGQILVVDDEWTVRQVLGKALKDYPLDTVEDGNEAVEQFHNKPYEVALIDLGIPGMPGDEVARRIKEADPRVVTVLITGWDVPAGDPRLLPFDFHIQKPFGLSEIRRLVEQAFARRAHQGEQGEV